MTRPAALALLEETAFDEGRAPDTRRSAAQALGGSEAGQLRLLELLRNSQLPDVLRPGVASILLNSMVD